MHFDWFDKTHHKSAQCEQKGFALPLVLAGALLIGLISIGGYYFLKQAPVASNKVIPQTSPQPEIKDGTADWKTYESKEMGFSVKCPPGWVYQETFKLAKTLIYIKDKQYQSETIIFGDKKTKNYLGEEVEPYPVPNFDISVVKDFTIEGLDMDEIVSSYINQDLISEVQNVTVDSIPAKLVKHRRCLAGNCVKVFIKNKESLVVLNINGEVSSSLKTLNKILAAFKFLDDETANPDSIGADWKIYSSKKYKYQLNYPTTWSANESLPKESTESGNKLQGDEVQKVFFSEINPQGMWQGFIEITVLNNPKNLSLEQWAKQYFRPLGADPTVNLAKIIGDTTFAGRPAKKFSVFSFDSHDIVIATVYNNFVYHIEFTGENPNDSDIEYHQKIYYQILSSFKFQE